MKQEFLSNLLGDISIGMYAAGIVISFIGILASLLYSVSKRDKNSQRTPYQFSWNVLLTDNAMRIYSGAFLNILLTFVILRFSSNLLGIPGSMFTCLGVGLFGDRFFSLLQNWNFIPSKKFNQNDQP